MILSAKQVKLDIGLLEEELLGCSVFTKEIMRRIVPIEGDIFSCLPEGISEFRLASLHEGGFNVGPENLTKTSESCLKSEVLNYVTYDSKRLVIIENGLANKSDEWIKSARSNICFYKGTVLHVLDYQSTSNMEVFFSESLQPIPSAIFFSELAEGYSVGQVLTEIDVENFANGLKKIGLMGVYDGESFLLCNLARVN